MFVISWLKFVIIQVHFNSDSEEIEQTWTEGSIVKLSERGANPRQPGEFFIAKRINLIYDIIGCIKEYILCKYQK